MSPPGAKILLAASNASTVVSDLVMIFLSPPGRYPKLKATNLTQAWCKKKIGGDHSDAKIIQSLSH